MEEEDLLPVNGGLTIPRSVGAGESLVRKTNERWDTLQQVEEQLRDLKIPDLKEPSVEPPTVTAEMLMTPDTKEYTVMFANTRVWYGYTNRLVARTNAALLEVTNQITNLEAELRKKIREQNKGAPKQDRLSNEQVADEVTTDPHWQELKLREQTLKQYKLELAAYFDDVERQLALISRQVEIRKEDNRGGRNEQNMPGRERGSYGLRTPDGTRR
jgi:hypothetical protein